MTKFITIGSCLAYTIGFNYRKTNRSLSNKAFFIASTRHTRIDKLVNTYLENKDPEISYDYVQKLNYDRNNEDVVKLVNNQFSSIDLGKTSLNSKNITGLSHTIKEKKIDLIIYDNFMDLLAKLIFSKENGQSFFINTYKADNWQDYFEMEKKRITISSCIDNYEKMARFFIHKNPHTKIIFVNFPLMQKHETARKRVQEVNEKYLQNDFLRENTFFVPGGYVSSNYLMNDHHFQEYQGRNLYQDYASIVQVLMDKKCPHSKWNEFVKDKQHSLLDYAHQRFSLATSMTV